MISNGALRPRRCALPRYLALLGGTAITAAAAVLAGGMPVTAATASLPAAGGSWSGPRELSQPRDSAGAGYFTALSCASRSDCTGVGIYGDRSGGDRVFAITERRGVWGKAVAIAVPTASKTIYVSAPVLSCASAGNCAAGGNYYVRRQQVAFVVSEMNGTWGKARHVPSEPDAMSCPAPGDCAAALARGYLLSERHGTWGTAFPVPGLAALADGNPVSFGVISCPSPGNCSAGGTIYAPAADEQSFVVTERHGTWGSAHLVKSPPGIATSIGALSCPSAGNCVAGGLAYPPNGFGDRSFAVTQTRGTWGTAEILPGTARLGGELEQLACRAPGDCTASGDFVVHREAQPFVSTEKNGTWHTAQAITGAGPGTAIYSLSCAAVGNCVLAGGILIRGQIQAGSAEQVNGRWGPARMLRGIRALDRGQDSQIEAVSCPARSGCTAVGSIGNFVAGPLFATTQR